MLSADVRKSKVNILKNKLKIVLLGAMCALFLQAPLSVSAVDLPFVPADESETVTTTVADNDTPMISESQTTTSKPDPQVTTSKSETSAKTTTAKATAAEDTANQNKPTETSRTADTERNDFPVIAPDGEEVEIEDKTGSEQSQETSTQSTASAENSTISSESKTETEKSDNSSLLIIIAVICGAAVIAVVTAFAVRKKGK